MSKSISKPYQIANDIWEHLQSGYDYSQGQSYSYGEADGTYGIYYFGIRGDKEIQFFSNTFAIAYQRIPVGEDPHSTSRMKQFIEWAVKYAQSCQVIESLECVAVLPPDVGNDYEVHEVYVVRLTDKEDVQHD